MKTLPPLFLALAIAAPLNSQSIPASAGEVYFSTELNRGDLGDQFGRSAACIGDLDNDGIPDLVVGASHSDDGASNAGSVWILFMTSLGSVRSSQKISATSGGFMEPLNASNQFGKSVVALGDLDGDGVLDIGVGAPSATTPADRHVFVLFLNTDGTVKSSATLSDTPNGFGRSLANMGDFDGDGVTDLMIGSGQGRAWLYYMNSDGSAKSTRTYNNRDDSTGGFPTFYSVGMDSIGDWDGDGVTDILIGDSGSDIGGLDLGVMYISLADPGGFPKSEIPLYDGLPGFDLGLVDYPNFGRDACLVGDLDGNGVQEIVIGCPEWYGGADPVDAGAVFIAFMQADGSVLEHRRISLTSGNLGQALVAGEEFGISVAPLGDINGDGVQDLAVGSRFGGTGSLFILRMNDGTLPPIVAHASASTYTGNLPLDVQFTDESTGPSTGWFWEFGDGATSLEQNPLHTYTMEGTYTASITVGRPGGGVDLYVLPTDIVVGPSLDVTADFASDTVQGVVPLLVNFTDTSVGIIDDWLWDFGDGTTSTLQNPSHTYTSVGFYDVTLDISNSGESDSLQRLGWIEVQAPPPTAAFTSDVTGGFSPLDVSFTDQSLDLPTSWLWDFGDGSTSTLQNPLHTFGTGTFTVSLTATNSTGSDNLTQVDLIVAQAPAPLADFSVDVLGGAAPLMVQFTDLSLQLPTTWSWDFGDGNVSSLQNPSHTYMALGSYQVSLVASNPTGSSMFSLPDPILVVGAAPVASFSADQSGGEAPLLVQFTDTSTDDPYVWAWDFGDGAVSSEQNPSHSYGAPGSYDVSLTVSNPLGQDVALAPAPIVVIPPSPVASFSVDFQSGYEPLSVTFTDTSLNAPTDWSWDFGDGASSTLQNPVHTYTTLGSFVVTLDATNSSGTSHFELPAPIVVSPVPPEADFSADVTNGMTPLLVQFTDLTTLGPTQWSWNFGDGVHSNLQNPSHLYTEPGVYNVSLSVVAPTGQDTEKKFNYIMPGLVPGISNGLFEDVVPPNTPVVSWPSTLGAPLLQDRTKVRHVGMPSQGRQWLQLSAAGSNNAQPPSHPGGFTEAPRGGAGVSQSFLLPGGWYQLSFDASFQLNGLPNSSQQNDWMSVDVSDGQTTFNVFYRDSFSEFLPAGLGQRMASTEVESVSVNLAELFPHVRAGTAMTVSMQVGNGGDDEAPSQGHLDNIRLDVASLLQAYGGELNPSGSLGVQGSARLGESLLISLDNPLGSQCAGSTHAQLFLSTQPDANFPLGSRQRGFGMQAGVGEALIDWRTRTHRFLSVRAGPWLGAGNPAIVELPIPNHVELLGLELFAQGLFLDESQSCGTQYGLTRALRIVVGP